MVEYYENGKKKVERDWKNGKPHSFIDKFNTDGRLIYKQNFIDGKADEVATEYEYYDGGSLKKATPYIITNSKKHGIEKIYYQFGKIDQEIPWDNGTINGIAKTYYGNGNVQWETPYKNGIRESILRYWRAGSRTHI